MCLRIGLGVACESVMRIERTADGWTVDLRSVGIGRFIGAAFLAVWLTGWAIGETFALWILTRGAWALFTGRPPGAGHNPLTLAVALPVGLFLLFWLTLWTF